MKKAKQQLDLSELAGALDEIAASADALALIAGLAEEDEQIRRRLPVIVRSLGRLLESKLTELARKVDTECG